MPGGPRRTHPIYDRRRRPVNPRPHGPAELEPYRNAGTATSPDPPTLRISTVVKFVPDSRT